MPTATRIIALTAAMAGAMLTVGCVGETATPEPSPEPTSTPVFASEEEALAAATEAYEAYLAVSDDVLSEGGVGVARLEPYVTSTYLEEERATYASFRESGWFSQGSSKFDSMTLQSYSGGGEASISSVVTYVCYDVSGVQLQNSEGVDVTPAERPERVPLQIEFLGDPSGVENLRVSRSDAWSGDNFC